MGQKMGTFYISTRKKGTRGTVVCCVWQVFVNGSSIEQGGPAQILIYKGRGSDTLSLPLLFYQKSPCDLGSSRSHVLLGEAAEFFKSYGVLDRHVRQDLAIQQHIRLLEGIDEPAVGQPVVPHCSTAARGPQTAEIAFSVLASDVGVDQPLIDALRGRTEQPAFPAVLPFGQFQPFVSPMSCFRSAFCARHDSILLFVLKRTPCAERSAWEQLLQYRGGRGIDNRG